MAGGKPGEFNLACGVAKDEIRNQVPDRPRRGGASGGQTTKSRGPLAGLVGPLGGWPILRTDLNGVKT